MVTHIVPIWLVGVATIAVVLVSIEGGYRLGRFANRRYGVEQESPVSVISAATLGLLAFLLAFTFGVLYNRFDARKELVRQEANAIGSAWLQTDFMQEKDRLKSLQLWKAYVDVRLAFTRVPSLRELPTALKKTDSLQHELWQLAVQNARADMHSQPAAIYVSTVNEVINYHGLRLARGYQARTSRGLWYALYALLLFCMFSIGYQIAVAKSRRTPATVILAMAFTVVFVLIAALDRNDSGFFRVPQQPLINLRASMEGAALAEIDLEEP